MVKYLFLYPAEVFVFIVALALLARGRIHPVVGWAAAAVGVVALAARLCVFPPEGYDLKIFWGAGTAIWRGQDPYADPRVLNPPTALPLFALLATLSFPAIQATWLALNFLGCVLMVFLARRTLAAHDPSGRWAAPAGATAVLTGVFVFSYACRFVLDSGQLSVLVTLALLAALYFQGRGLPLAAGAFLAVATIKVHTMAPFLLLFLRKKDWPAWPSMAVVGAALCFATTSPVDLPTRLDEEQRHVRELAAPGGANDYEFTNVTRVDVIALDGTLYDFGLRDRTLIAALQLVGLGLLGAWTAWKVLGPRAYPPPAACALVACYASVFLYHRFYDLSILVLPLVYAAGRAMTERGRIRWWYAAAAAAAAAVLLVLYLWTRELEVVNGAAMRGGAAGQLLGVAVLPYGVWAILSAMACLAVGENGRRKQAVAQGGNGGGAAPSTAPTSEATQAPRTAP